MDYKAGMFIYALAILLGDVLVQQLRVLPGYSELAMLLIGVCLLTVATIVIKRVCKNYTSRVFFTLIIYLILLFLISFIYSSLYAKHQLSNRLDEQLIGKNIVVSGVVSDIPVANGHVQRFTFKVDDVRTLAKTDSQHTKLLSADRFPRKIRLSWYYGKKITASEKWQFEVRLKPPHGFMNPAGFDYESWLFQQRLEATGYVRKSTLNQQIHDSSTETFFDSVHRYRQMLALLVDSIAEKRRASTNNSATQADGFALIKALAIGDKSSITNSQWEVLVRTGTSHLMAISGLHIGLSALFGYVLVRRIVPAFVIRRIPAQHVALIAGLFVALLYALVAGLSITTQRAIIMLFAVSMMMLIRHNHRPFDVLGFALIVILIFDPMAILSVGFWFSFAAVAAIYISLSTNQPSQSADKKSVIEKPRLIIKQWIKLQLTLSIFLLPLSLYIFQQVSLISPVANLLLIPYVSFLVVPVVLLAVICVPVAPSVAELLFILAASMIDFIWPVLSYLSAQPYSLWVEGEVGMCTLLVATTFIVLVFISLSDSSHSVIRKTKKGYRLIIVYLAVPALILILWLARTSSDNKLGEYTVTVLDVGQGSAAVLQTQNHIMVFDAGAKFSDRFDSGRSIVIPYLRSQSVSVLDYLIISHGDSDHIGGAQAIIDEYSDVTVIGQDIENLNADKKQSCIEGFKWQWDGVSFEFLSPAEPEQQSSLKVKRNNRSCVLSVSSDFGSVLFTGDAEKMVERRLLNKYAKRLASDVLIVPHHGSNTSSSRGFVDAVNPRIALFSVGYKNRYKLPSKKVINRYISSKSIIFQTAESGAITVKFDDDNGVEVTKYRESAEKYWNHVIN